MLTWIKYTTRKCSISDWIGMEDSIHQRSKSKLHKQLTTIFTCNFYCNMIFNGCIIINQIDHHYTPRNVNMVHALCFVVVRSIWPIAFGVNSPILGHSHNCTSGTVTALMNMGKCIVSLKETTARQSRMQPGTYFMGYSQQIFLQWHVYW